MKLYFFIPFLIMLIGCTSMQLEQRQTQRVIDLPGLNKNQIYQKSKQWIANSFVSARAVTEYSDKDEGRIIGNITTTYNEVFSTVYVKSTITIDAKEGKARLTITPNSVSFNNPNDPREIYGETELNKVHRTILPLHKSYESYMKTASQKDDSW